MKKSYNRLFSALFVVGLIALIIVSHIISFAINNALEGHFVYVIPAGICFMILSEALFEGDRSDYGPIATGVCKTILSLIFLSLFSRMVYEGYISYRSAYAMLLWIPILTLFVFSADSTLQQINKNCAKTTETTETE